MDASTLLADLTKAGIALRIEGERLMATPGHLLTDAHRDLIRRHKGELLALVRGRDNPPPLTVEDQDAIAEAIEERASILEFEAGLSRPVADAQAASAMRVYQARIAMPDADPRWLVLLAPGCDLADARRTLDWRFGAERVLDVREARS